MSKTTIPICKLPEEECNVLFASVIQKLKIEKPTFFYPIYKKLVNNDTTQPEELQNFVLDSKYKCKEILEKLVDSDDEDVFDTDDEQDSEQEQDLENPARKDSETLSDTKSISSENSHTDENNENSDNELNMSVLNDDIKDTPIEDEDNLEEEDLENYDTYDDKEIEEAISNTYMAMAMIEKVDKNTGEKICKEEMIHVKKTALLDPLKVMKDEYVIPSKVQNKNSSDETLKNTMSKLNSYNNCGHVESLFLYLGNKLVETGKCPSFPYYYGCVNGEDPNYHHNITDEYESVSRTKWFKDRVKTDFDLLIIEDGDIEQCEEENRKIRKPSNCRSSDSDSDSDSDNSSDNDSDNDSNKKQEQEQSQEQSQEHSIIDSSKKSEPSSRELEGLKPSQLKPSQLKPSPADEVVSALDKQFETIAKQIEKKSMNSNEECKEKIEKTSNLSFIKNMDDEDLEIEVEVEGEVEGENIQNIQEGGLQSTDSIKCDSECEEKDNDDDDDDEDDFIEVLSDVDKDNLSITDFEDKPGNMYYIKCENMPVSLSLMEKLDDTLDNVLDDDYNMSEKEWFSMFFQVSFGLSVAQKYFNFVHNDLHSSNVMFKKTLLKYLYFQVDNHYYRIPTFGKITKIIDFARGTFKFGDRWVFSDQFKEDGDAYGQYDYPVDGSLKNCEHKPNPSFDLVRLGTTVIQRLQELPKVREFVEQITLNDYDNSVCYDEDTFDLYIDIARHCHNAIPIEVMKRKEFECFQLHKNKIPKGQYIFKY
jgi:hypothetical protein